MLARYRLGHEYKEFDASKHKRARTTTVVKDCDNDAMKIESVDIESEEDEDSDEWRQFIDNIGTSTVHKELTAMAML